MKSDRPLSPARTRVVLTGGGTAGHVTPLLALLPEFKKLNFSLLYVGSHLGIESRLAPDAGLPYQGISTGKLRRHFSLKNLSDFFRVGFGMLEAVLILYRFKPDLILSKGGFVSVPVCLAAAFLRIPVCTHESDLSPGLATRIISKFATRILCNFEATLKVLPRSKSACVGLPLRESLLKGKANSAFQFLNLQQKQNRPLLLVIGGSSGAVFLNDLVKASLDLLLEHFQIAHITGPKNGDLGTNTAAGYVCLPYVGTELPDLFEAAQVVITRAGATTICELAALKKPMVLIPLERGSRGDQVLNAKLFSEKNLGVLLLEDSTRPESLLQAIQKAFEKAKHVSPEVYAQFHPEVSNQKYMDEVLKLLP